MEGLRASLPQEGGPQPVPRKRPAGRRRHGSSDAAVAGLHASLNGPSTPPSK